MKTQALKTLKPELFWWFLLASTVSMLFAVTWVVCAIYQFSSPFRDNVLVGVWALCEILLCRVSIKKLKTHYLATNDRWKMRLKFSLTDLLSIAFFFGGAMLLLRGFNPRDFADFGLMLAIMLGIGYFLCLIFSIRQGGFAPGIATWLIACLRLGVAVIFLICGFLVQTMVLALILGIFFRGRF